MAAHGLQMVAWLCANQHLGVDIATFHVRMGRIRLNTLTMDQNIEGRSASVSVGIETVTSERKKDSEDPLSFIDVIEIQFARVECMGGTN